MQIWQSGSAKKEKQNEENTSNLQMLFLSIILQISLNLTAA